MNINKELLIKDILQRGSDHLDVFGGDHVGGHYIQQVPEELADAVIWLSENGPIHSILEIGSASGGTLRLLADYLKIKYITLIDNNEHPKAIYRNAILDGLEYDEWIGDSHSKECKAFLAGKGQVYDLVYIDAGHTYQDALLDIMLAYPYAYNLMMFHDTVACPDVKAAINANLGILKKLVFSTQFGPKAKGIEIYSV